ncbi:methyltransferase [Nocardia cyriacigeorgica]|uniref:methyltransferase n=1 Tax=Nocardia cyriacigeorgica TaxID=135487 RepID=UPI0018945707|nr:methyltransferase [Nocardia cyriacigeorgica]MBF6435192.1 methyltransferase [Nocardia cyriacigeorgica]MBF6454742.1 methyltransferase [Nocardia cyriacigeorgica]MBF6477166.1 methyltransferase [Nocardia cyriacigeorgica]MBF6552636.1 methyltransferase [Nocardia cyriacigeorgica]
MGKLSKRAAAAHREACALVALRRELCEDEKLFVLANFQESSVSGQSAVGAFFTPAGLARDMSIEVVGRRLIDLGAGIGQLAFACRDLWGRANGEPVRDLVCVERNPVFVRVGRKVLPEARWLCGDLLRAHLERMPLFDTAIANPPFGAVARSSDAPGYHGPRFEYHTITIAARVARHGVFLIPQSSAPFRYSGQPRMHDGCADAECQRFHAATGITLDPSCGIDTSGYRDNWHHPTVATEVVTSDFTTLASAHEPSPPATPESWAA